MALSSVDVQISPDPRFRIPNSMIVLEFSGHESTIDPRRLSESLEQ